MITKDDIRKLGLPEKDAQVYLALLRLGGGLPAAIAKDAGVNRATTYEVLTRLHERGLAMKLVKKNKYYFTCAEPQAFSEYLETRKRQIEKYQEEFVRLEPQLNYFYSHSNNKPKILFFDTTEGIRQALFHSLEGTHEEVISFTSLRMMSDFFEPRVFQKYASALVKRGIRLRYLDYDVADKQLARQFIAKYFPLAPKHLIPHIEFVPSMKPAANIVLIYSTFVSLIDVSKPELMAVIIENEDIAETFRLMFEAAWPKSKKQ